MKKKYSNPEFQLERTFQAKTNFIHRKVADMDVLISIGENVVNFNGYIELNSSAAILWDFIQEPHEIGDMVDIVMEKFDVEYETAVEDVKNFLSDLYEHQMIEVH